MSESRIIKALGNGSYRVTAWIRFAGMGGILAILGAMYWAGSTASGLDEKLLAISDSISVMIVNQIRIDSRQEGRLDRHGTRLRSLERARIGAVR